MTNGVVEKLMLETDVVMTPTPKGRPRFTSHGRTYTPAATMKAEKEVADKLRLAAIGWGGVWPKTGPLAVEVDFMMPVPQSWSKKKKQQAHDGDLWHTSRPDVDNLLKLVLDAANGVLWVDDAQIVSFGASKSYADKNEQVGFSLRLYSLRNSDAPSLATDPPPIGMNFDPGDDA